MIAKEAKNSTERIKLIKAQIQICDDLGIPMFAPPTGRCWSCNEFCVDDRWAKEHITGCSKCNRTFCD